MAGTHTSINKPNMNNNMSDKPNMNIVSCNIGNVVLVKGEKIIGVVTYKGTVDWDNSNRQYIGLVLSDPIPNGHNGTQRGRQYFKCTDKHGIIIASHLVSRTITSSELLQKVTNLNNAFKQCYNQSQQLQRKYMEIRETLQRVEGENKSLRERLEYYETRGRRRSRKGDRTNPYIYQSRSRSQSRSESHSFTASPSPNTRIRSKSNVNGYNKRRRTFVCTKGLPPLPPNKLHTKSVPPSPIMNPMSPIQMTPDIHDEPDMHSYGIPTPLTINTKMKKSSKKKVKMKKRKKVYRRKRSNSNDTYKSVSRSRKSSYISRKSSYKSRKSSFKSRTTTDRCQDSPMPLSIGDHMGGTIKMLIPNVNTPKMQRSYSTNTLDILNDESESHDYQDSGTNYTRTRTDTSGTRHYDDGDIIDESDNEMFSPLTAQGKTQVSLDTSITSQSISTRKTTTPKSGSGNYGQRYISKFVPRDLESVDDDDVMSAVLYNEENDLELGSVGGTMQNIYENTATNNGYDIKMKPPTIIQEDNEMDVQQHNLAPHIVEEEDISSDNIDIMNGEIDNLSDSDSQSMVYEQQYDPIYQQQDEDSHLEIETPQPVNNQMNNNVAINMFKPQEQVYNNNKMKNETKSKILDTHITKPLPPLIPKQSTHSTHSSHKNVINNNNLNANVHSIQYSGSLISNDMSSIPDNVGLYAETHIKQASNVSNLISDTQSSARYSNTPSYTHTVTTTTNTISPQKNHKHNFKKRMSHTPAAIRLPGKFNPAKKFSSVPAEKVYRDGFLSDSDMNIDMMDPHNNGVFAAQSILNNMKQSKSLNNMNDNGSHSDNNLQTSQPNSHHFPAQNINVNMFPQNNIGNFHNMIKRKTIGGSATALVSNQNNNNSKKRNPNKKLKKRVIRSRTFVSTADTGQKFNCLETAKQLNKSTLQHQREATPDINFAEEKSYRPVPTTPKTAPFNPVTSPNGNQITLDDFQLDHALDTDLELSQHNSHNPRHIHHKQYYSQHINSQRKSNKPPVGTPTLVNAKSEHQKTKINGQDFYRKSRKGNKDIPNHIHTNMHTNSNRKRMKLKRSRTTNGSNDSKSPHRNLGSLTHIELKGLLEADNLFTYDNYQKIVQ